MPPAEGNTAAQKQVWKKNKLKQNRNFWTGHLGEGCGRDGRGVSNYDRKPLQQEPTQTSGFCFVNLICDVTMSISEPMNVPLKNVNTYAFWISQCGLNTTGCTQTSSLCFRWTLCIKDGASQNQLVRVDRAYVSSTKLTTCRGICNVHCSLALGTKNKPKKKVWFKGWSRHAPANKNSLQWNSDIAKNTRPTSTNQLKEVTLMRFCSRALTSVAKMP